MLFIYMYILLYSSSSLSLSYIIGCIISSFPLVYELAQNVCFNLPFPRYVIGDV